MIENINTDIIKHKNTWNKKQYNSLSIYILNYRFCGVYLFI